MDRQCENSIPHHQQCIFVCDLVVPSILHSHLNDIQQNLLKRPLSKRQKIAFQDQLLLNAGQRYFRMLQGEHSAIILTFIKLPFVIKIFILSIFEWPFYTGFTVVGTMVSNK